MSPNVSEWLNLIARWVHVFVGILWIGQTYFFTWLDGRLTEEGQVWMVHSGGFYVVERRKAPGPRELRWFRWEAAFTWLSGMILLAVVYYMGGALVDTDVRDISVRTGIAVGLGLLVVAWVVYDLMVRSPLGNNGTLFGAVSFMLLIGVAYGLCHTFSGRAAYIHVGAMFGTIMTANVWMRILPAQRRMIAATKQGKMPDAALAAQAKLRSKHNTYMVVPLIFTMISNHFPVATYGYRYNWAVLAAFILAGWGAARLIRRA
jgi:uncharacterized membrane protein